TASFPRRCDVLLLWLKPRGGRLRPVGDHLRSPRSDIVDEPSEKLVKNVRRFPKRRVLQSRQAMASPFPQIRIFRNFEISEVDKRILRPVHHGQGDGKIFDETALIYPDARARGFKNRLSSEAVRTLYCASKRNRRRRAEDCLTESIDFRWTKIL